MSSIPKRSDARGFTLLELLIAVSITAMLIVAVLEVFQVSLYAREEVKALSEPMTTGPRILDMIEEDIQSVWTFNIKDDRIFKGENRSFVGDEADRMHLLVTGRTIHQVRLTDDTFRPAPVAEVSYLVKGSNENANHLELWRREDPLIDNDMYKGGYYQLLSSRIRKFNITYYEELGIDAEPFDEWDSAEKGALPRRIKIELNIERSKDTFNKLRETEDLGSRVDEFIRHVVFDPQTVNALKPGIALLPAVPDAHPEAEDSQAGGGGAAAAREGARGKGGEGATSTSVGAKGADRKQGGNRGATSPFPGGNRGASGGNFDQILRDLRGAGGNRGGGGSSRR